jgi:uncharacterized damage-inducible protein DinB
VRPVVTFLEPTGETADSAVLFSRYLSFYRETVLRKLGFLSDVELRTSRLVSGWTPIELLSHLAHMEQRWLIWGFLGEHVEEPWGDQKDDRWHVPEHVTPGQLTAMLRSVGERTTTVLTEHSLEEKAPPGPRFDGEPATLAWICFHVLQEYARHAGHLDIAVELAAGNVGE